MKTAGFSRFFLGGALLFGLIPYAYPAQTQPVTATPEPTLTPETEVANRHRSNITTLHLEYIRDDYINAYLRQAVNGTFTLKL